MLVTEGDSMADLVRQEGLGVVVRPRSVEDVAAGFERLLSDHPFRAGCATEAGRVSADFRWSVVARPLLEFCRAPRRSPDAQRRLAAANPGLGVRAVSSRATARAIAWAGSKAAETRAIRWAGRCTAANSATI